MKKNRCYLYDAPFRWWSERMLKIGGNIHSPWKYTFKHANTNPTVKSNFQICLGSNTLLTFFFFHFYFLYSIYQMIITYDGIYTNVKCKTKTKEKKNKRINNNSLNQLRHEFFILQILHSTVHIHMILPYVGKYMHCVICFHQFCFYSIFSLIWKCSWFIFRFFNHIWF